MPESKKNVFEILNAVDVSKHIETKNNLSYLCWNTFRSESGYTVIWIRLKRFSPNVMPTYVAAIRFGIHMVRPLILPAF